ncbi:MAG: hypothetical protein HYT73_04385 [Candidatus Aenigmarchaeota archaeon]|nr:hypothetical protein [Candidatus Aenigmarchaeota archaeon]
MFGFLKKKRKEEMDDFFDIKNTITGRQPERDVIDTGKPFAEQKEDEWVPSFPGRKDLGFEDMGQPAMRGPSKDYDVMQRLDVIESQLQAIRSQTETINERLKNLEFKLTGGRRY